MIAGYANVAEGLGVGFNRLTLGAAILPSDHLFTLGWRTVYKLEGYYGSYGLISTQGPGVYPEFFAFLPGIRPPHFPYGVAVSPGLFPWPGP